MKETAIMLKNKYGLSDEPDNSVVKQWKTKVERYIAVGMDSEKAGIASAIVIFPNYGMLHYVDDNPMVVEILDTIDKYR